MSNTTHFGVPGGGPVKGPAFEASYASTCSYCDNDIERGEMIRADGDGGWEHAEHQDEDDG